MIKFKKYDEIEHPTFGRGVVKKITKVNDTISLLDIYFDKTKDKRQLNSVWVEEFCTCYCAMKEENIQGKYVSIELPNYPKWKLELNKNIVLTEELQKNIYYILSQMKPGISFVLLGNLSTVVFLESEYKTYKSIEKFARRHMSSVFAHHKDFSIYTLENKGIILMMSEGRLWHFIKPEDVVMEGEEVSFETSILGRTELLEVCEKKEIWGIIRAI